MILSGSEGIASVPIRSPACSMELVCDMVDQVVRRYHAYQPKIMVEIRLLLR